MSQDRAIVKTMKKVIGALQDKPWVVTCTLFAVTVTLFLGVSFWGIPNYWSDLAKTPVAEALTLYIGVAGAASLVAGFAGVVVVFGLSGTGSSQRVFRASAGRSLRANWLSVIGTGFGAAALAFAAALMPVLQLRDFAPWVMQMALVFLTHASVRLIWLMKLLIDNVKSDDAQTLDAGNVKPLPTGRRRTSSS